MRCRDVISGLLLLLIAFGAGAADFDGRYVPKVGDFNGDGRADIYLQHQPKFVQIDLDDLSVPIPTSRRTLSEFVLQQNASGGFSPLALNPADLTTVRAWPKAAALKLLLGDFNLDGNQDVVINNARAISSTALDAIVIAPPTTGTSPPYVRSIDSQLLQFTQDVDGWTRNRNYFASGYVVVWSIEYMYVPLYSCGGVLYYSDPNYPPQNYPGCTFLGWNFSWVWWPTEYFDSSRFSAKAIEFLNLLLPYINNPQLQLQDADASQMRTVLSQALGFTFWPMPDTIDVPPPVSSPEHERLKQFFKWVIRVARGGGGIIAGVLIPSPIEDATLTEEQRQQAHEALLAAAIEAASAENPGFITLYHGTIVVHALALLNGAPLDASKAEANRNFPGDELGFYLATNVATAGHWGAVAAQLRRTDSTVIRYRFTIPAHNAVLQAGARYRKVFPITQFQADAGFELIVPVHAFGVFNLMRQQGQIVVTPY